MDQLVFLNDTLMGKLIKRQGNVIHTDNEIFSCHPSSITIVEVESYEQYLQEQKAKKRAEKKAKLYKEIDDTNNELIRILEDIALFCSTLGYKIPQKKLQLIQQRQAKRTEAEGL